MATTPRRRSPVTRSPARSPKHDELGVSDRGAATREILPLLRQVDVYSTKERDMREIDAIYDMITDPAAVRMRRTLAGLESYVKRRFELEYTNRYSPRFAELIDELYATCAETSGARHVRTVRQLALFAALVDEGRVRAYLCEPGATDSVLDERRTLVDPTAFTLWLRDYALGYTNDLVEGTRTDVPAYTQACAAAYVALLRNSPYDHPRARARKRRSGGSAP